MPGTFSPPEPVSDPDIHHGTCVTHVQWCLPGSLTSGFLWSRWRGKLSRHSRRMRNPQFCVSGKRPMALHVAKQFCRACCLCAVEQSLSQWEDTVYPKKYAHGFCFAVLCCGYTLTDFPISIRLTSLALRQSNDCPSASKATLMNMDKCFMWIHYERLHNHNKAKHNKTVCIFLGIYCTPKSMAENTLSQGLSHWQKTDPDWTLNTLRPRQNRRHFADAIFKCIFLNENVWILINISLKFVPKGLINNIPPLVQIMAWRRPGDKPLSEPMMVNLLTHICLTLPQWVNVSNFTNTGIITVQGPNANYIMPYTDIKSEMRKLQTKVINHMLFEQHY